MWIVWWTAASASGHGAETWVAAYPPGGSSSDRPLSVFPIRRGLDGDGEQAAVLLGDAGMNGACGVELADGTLLWPTYNPVAEGRWAPRPGAPGLGAARGGRATPARTGTAAVAGLVLLTGAAVAVTWWAAGSPVAGAVVPRVTAVAASILVPVVTVRWRLRGGR